MHQRGPVAPPALRLVKGERYADWEAIYQDNAILVYRMLYAKVGNRPFRVSAMRRRCGPTCGEHPRHLQHALTPDIEHPVLLECVLLNNSGLVTPCAPSAPVGR
jgi:hypothetical protein